MSDDWRDRIEPVCEACSDTGWIRLVCTGADCGRRRRHPRHEYVVPCSCRPMNPVYQQNAGQRPVTRLS